MKRRLYHRSTVAIAISALPVISVPSRALAEGISFLDPKGPVAATQASHFYDIILLMLIVVVPVMLFTPLVAWRYRYRNRRARYSPKWKFSWPLEALVWGVPFAVVIVLSVWLWQDSSQLDPYKPISGAGKPLRVNVISYDWKWLFVYPDLHIATMGQLAFPADRPLSLRLTSDSVMQAFFVPALGSQIYTMAGMQTRLHLKADAPGQFLGENTQYNGEKFHKQKFQALAMSDQDFRDWLQAVRAKGVALTPDVYNHVRAKGTVDDVRKAVGGDMPPDTVYLKDVPAHLFVNVINSYHGGGQTSQVLLGGATTTSHLGPNWPQKAHHQSSRME